MRSGEEWVRIARSGRQRLAAFRVEEVEAVGGEEDAGGLAGGGEGARGDAGDQLGAAVAQVGDGLVPHRLHGVDGERPVGRTRGLLALRTAYGTARLRDEVVANAGQELRVARERYRLGVASAVEVTDAETSLAEAERARIDAVYAYHRSLAALEAMVGRDLRGAAPAAAQ